MEEKLIGGVPATILDSPVGIHCYRDHDQQYHIARTEGCIGDGIYVQNFVIEDGNVRDTFFEYTLTTGYTPYLGEVSVGSFSVKTRPYDEKQHRTVLRAGDLLQYFLNITTPDFFITHWEPPEEGEVSSNHYSFVTNYNLMQVKHGYFENPQSNRDVHEIAESMTWSGIQLSKVRSELGRSPYHVIHIDLPDYPTIRSGEIISTFCNERLELSAGDSYFELINSVANMYHGVRKGKGQLTY